MPSLLRLLSKGYFPRELPLCFSSVGFGRRTASNRRHLPQGFQRPPEAAMLNYSLARPGGLRRKLSMPNPVLQFALFNEIHLSWGDIYRHTHQSPFSLSIPPPDPRHERALVPKIPLDLIVYEKARNRFNARFILRADLAEFYPSLYTHSIAWALHTKPIARA